MVSWLGLNTLFAGAHAPSTTGRRSAKLKQIICLKLKCLPRASRNKNSDAGAIDQTLLAYRRNSWPKYTSLTSSFARMVAERSEEHTSELQSLMRSSYAVFCLKKKKKNIKKNQRLLTYTVQK